jgi:CRP-like cAMP-binding protein
MAATEFAIDQTQFAAFTPLDRLAPRSMSELLGHSRIQRLPPGRALFSRGEADGETVFLLTGQVALIADGPVSTIRAQTEEARRAIADTQPRLHTAIARTAAMVLCVDSAVLQRLLTEHEAAMQETAAPVADAPDTANRPMLLPPPPARPPDAMPNAMPDAIGEMIGNDGDETGNVLPPLFERLPAMHRRLLQRRIERIEVPRGTEVARQGERCTHFDLIEQGSFQLRRRRGRSGERELGAGDGIGAEVLLAGESRHDASAIAREDSVVLRVPRREFLALVARHYCRRISALDLPALMGSGDAILLDLRPPASYRRAHVPDSINFPLPLLLSAAPTLDTGRRYVLGGDSVRHCAAAAFRLAQQGARTFLLHDPLRTVCSNA